MRNKIIASALALALLVGLGVGAAAAAQLHVTTASAASFDQLSACAAAMDGSTPVVDTSNPSTESVEISNVPSACAGLPLHINLHNSTGAIIASGTAASAAGTQDVTVGTYSAKDVDVAVATIGGWIFPTAWSANVLSGTYCEGLDADGSVSTDTCTLTIASVAKWQAGGYWYEQFQFSAVTSAPLWRITLDFSDTTYFEGFTPTVVSSNQNVALAPGYSCSSLPMFQGVEANPGWGSPNGDLQVTNDPNYTPYNALCD